MKTITVTMILFLGCAWLCYTPIAEASFSCWAAPFTFGRICNGAYILGHNGYKRYYSVTIFGNAGTLVCCQAKGFDANRREKWYSIGCDYSSLGWSVNWGNIAAHEAVKCKGTPFGASVQVN